MTRRTSLSDPELNAFIDGELMSEEAESVGAWLAAHPDDAQRAAGLRRADEAIRMRYASVIEEPLPREMSAILAVHTAARPAARFAVLAAAAVLLLVAGGAGGYLWRDAELARSQRVSNFVGGAIGAHQIFAPEVRHPVEVGADQEEHLVKWLTKRLGADIRAPRLKSHGLELIGGRLLPAGGEPAAQFMYQDKSGRRLSLYLRVSSQKENTAFQIAQAGNVSALYWIDNPLACAIIAEMSREQLMQIAHTVYGQLD